MRGDFTFNAKRTTKAQARALVRLRYGDGMIKKRAFSLNQLRLSEIEDIILYRHGRRVPEPVAIERRPLYLRYATAAAGALCLHDLGAWVAQWLPWATPEEIAEAANGEAWRKYMMSAEDTADLLLLTMKDRTDLAIRTIGACDITEKHRKAIAAEMKRDKDRARKDAARRGAGCLRRSDYEANSLAASKPWEAEGISRRTWYRRNGTSASRVVEYTIGDGPVPNAEGGARAPPAEQNPKIPGAPERMQKKSARASQDQNENTRDRRVA